MVVSRLFFALLILIGFWIIYAGDIRPSFANDFEATEKRLELVDDQNGEIEFIQVSALFNPRCGVAKKLSKLGLKDDRDLITYVWKNIVSLQKQIDIEKAIEALFPGQSYRVQVTDQGVYGQIDFCRNAWNIYGASVLVFGTEADGMMRISANILGYSDRTIGIVKQPIWN